MLKFLICACAALCSVSVAGQDEGPLQAIPVAAAPAHFLPANTEVLLAMNQEVTTKGKRWNEGDTFEMSVVHDVMLDNMVIIPRGSRGVGQITWLTDKGMFGKSGKMDIELKYVEVGGRRIDVTGTYRQEGEGNTVATVGGVVLAGPFAAFITGKSGRIPQGRELMARTLRDIPVTMPAAPTAPVAAVTAVQPPSAPSPSPTNELSSDSAVKCETCR